MPYSRARSRNGVAGYNYHNTRRASLELQCFPNARRNSLTGMNEIWCLTVWRGVWPRTQSNFGIHSWSEGPKPQMNEGIKARYENLRY
jgi:hypothetical protein